jgi:dTDP-4-dehydrorhamnose 3,5-epimerase
MKFHELPLPGAYWIELDRKEDQRGFFARSFCEEEFLKQGLTAHFPQCNISFNSTKGTLRGLHYSIEPCSEVKMVRCTKGSVYDVLVDLRSDLSSYLKWTPVELSSDNRKILYIPKGIAHGFQTLEDNCELFYQMSVSYNASCARGVRWNDAALQIKWPLQNPIMSPRDQEFPNIKK